MTDPRHFVTPDAFAVAPELLGQPLARPWRRAVAMMIDLLLVAVLANAPSVLLGFAAALVLFRISAPAARAGFLARAGRLLFRFGAAVVLFVVVVSAWGSVTDWFDDDEPVRATVETESGAVTMSGMAGLQALGQIAELRSADDEMEAALAATRIADALTEAGLEPDEVREAVRAAAEETDRPWVTQAVDSVMRDMTEPAADPVDPDSRAIAAARAFADGDTLVYDSLRPQLVDAVAGDEIAALRREIERGEEQNRELRGELEEAQQPTGIMTLLRTLLDDLGLGFGWSALYFTAFTALWRGQTPGKRLFGIRVVQLNGTPIGWWEAFGRFGGYAAGFATGLLGFLQVLWDRNRQGIQDKISETVVIQM